MDTRGRSSAPSPATEQPETQTPEQKNGTHAQPASITLDADGPSLTIENGTTHVTVVVYYQVEIQTDADAAIWEYFGTNCEGDSDLRGASQQIASPVETSRSYRAFWGRTADGPGSICLNVTWENPAPADAPQLTIDGVAADASVEVDDWITVEAESDAHIRQYDNATCEGEGYFQSSPHELSSFEAQSSSFKAVWIHPNSRPESDCLKVTWRSPAPELAPILRIDGESNNSTKLVGESVEISTETYAELFVYPNATNCEGVATPINDAHYNDSSNVPTSKSYQSVWTDWPNAPASYCLTVTWSNPVPTVAPILTLDGGTENVTVPLSVSVIVSTENGATIWQFTDATCTEDAEDSLSSGYGIGNGSEQTIYFQARWQDSPSAPASDCLKANWATAPAMTLNGTRGDVSVDGGGTITFAPENGSDMLFYRSLDCSGSRFGQTGQISSVENPAGTVYSVHAVTQTDPPLQGDCYVAKWVAAPVMALNGTEADVTVDVGEEIVFTATNDAHLEFFAAEGCTGMSESFGAEHTIAQTLPTTITVRAVSNADGSLTSDCFTATWMKTTTVRIHMWDESSLEGASWSLYAPAASQVAGGAYLTGVLDASNTASFTDLPAGEYRFVVEPAGQGSIEFTVTISNVSESLVLQVAQPVDPATPEPTTGPGTPEPTTVPPTPEPTTTPSTPVPATPGATNAPAEPATTAAAVSGLPETGAGSGSSSVIIGLAGLLAAALLLTIGSRRLTRS